MPPLKFCANLSWLFNELPEFTQRFQSAAAAGFRAVEAAWLYDADLLELQKAKKQSGVEVVLINTPPGDLGNGDCGLGAVPGREADFRRGLELAMKYAKALDCSREADFRRGLELAMKYAKALDCSRIHLMAGRIPMGLDRAAAAEMEATFIENLTYAANVLLKEGILGLVEPINTRITDPRYFLNTPHQAADILQKVGSPNLKLQMDIFHWQIMDGNLTQNIKTYFPLIGKWLCVFYLLYAQTQIQDVEIGTVCRLAELETGHIQIAQVPDRNEPDSQGEVNFQYLFSLLEEMGYQGYVGCEYRPLVERRYPPQNGSAQRPAAMKYAKALDCSRIHLMAGRIPMGLDRAAAAEMEATFIENLTYAANVLLKVKVADESHIQIAQVPDRNEPDSQGEVNFQYLFSLLEEMGYQGYVGCEYRPLGNTEDGLGWLREYWNSHK
ncbi:UNVERIFIED_CONTAM: hypothetical protein FKN15_068273 [Acipenser sinensis]